jgi:hypothetical protein
MNKGKSYRQSWKQKQAYPVAPYSFGASRLLDKFSLRVCVVHLLGERAPQSTRAQ